MSYKENSKMIGKKATVSVGGLDVAVKILDYKFSYGRDRWLVTPIAGAREIWIETVTLADTK